MILGMTKYFALLRVSSDKDVMAIEINLYQGIPNLMNISDNKMVQIPEHHHTINVKNEKKKKKIQDRTNSSADGNVIRFALSRKQLVAITLVRK